MSLAASVIIPTFNRASILAQTLPGILQQTQPPESFEVLVIDDGSTDATPAVAVDLACSQLVYHRFKNSGRAKARNRALTLARGELLVFLDDDGFVPPHFLTEHLRAHHAGSGFMVSGPIVTVDRAPTDFSDAPFWRGWHRNPFPTCNASVAKQHILAAGGFDEEFNLYGWEDLELAERLRALGLKRHFARRASMFHFKPASPAQSFGSRLALERERGAMGALFFRKHPTLRVGVMTKMWWPFRALDVCFTKLFGLEKISTTTAQLQSDRHKISPLTQGLLLYHAEVAAGRTGTEAGRRVTDNIDVDCRR